MRITNETKKSFAKMYSIVTLATLALLLFSHPAAAAPTKADDDVVQSSARQLEKVCGKLTEILAAKTSIPLPVAKVRMGKMHLPVVSRKTRACQYGMVMYPRLTCNPSAPAQSMQI